MPLRGLREALRVSYFGSTFDGGVITLTRIAALNGGWSICYHVYVPLLPMLCRFYVYKGNVFEKLVFKSVFTRGIFS